MVNEPETHVIYFDKLKRFGQEVMNNYPFYSKPILPDEYKQEMANRYHLDLEQFYPYGIDFGTQAIYYSHLHLILYSIYAFFEKEEEAIGNLYFPTDITFQIDTANGLHISSNHGDWGPPIYPTTVKARASKEQTPEEIQDHFFNTLVALAKEYIYSDAFKRIAESYSEVVGEK